MYFNTKNTKVLNYKIFPFFHRLTLDIAWCFICFSMSPSLQCEAICRACAESTCSQSAGPGISVHTSLTSCWVPPPASWWTDLFFFSGHEWGNQSPIPSDFHSNSFQTGDPQRISTQDMLISCIWGEPGTCPLIHLPRDHGTARLDQRWFQYVLPYSTLECACPALNLMTVPKLPLAAEGGSRRQISWKKELIATPSGM